MGIDGLPRLVATDLDGTLVRSDGTVSERAHAVLRKVRDAGIAVVAGRVDGLDPDGLRALADTLRDRLGSGVVCVGSAVDGRVHLVAAATKDVARRFPAGKLIQEVAAAVGGRGGGRPDLAQAGGTDPSRLDGALALVYDWVARTAS